MEKEKIKTLTLALVLMVAIVGAGFVVFSIVGNSVINPSSSKTINSTFAQTDSIFSIVPTVAIIAFVCFFAIVIPSYFISNDKRYQRLSKTFQYLRNSLYYFAYGCILLVTVAVPSALLYLLYTYTVVEGNTGVLLEAVKWLLILVGSYIGIALLGYFFKHKMIDKYRRMKNENIQRSK